MDVQGKICSAPRPPHLSDSNRRIIDMQGPSPSLRVYQLWKGSNKFVLGGRLIFGPDMRSLFLTVSLIVGPVILFYAFVSQGIVKAFQLHIGNLFVAIPALFAAYIIVLLFLTSGRDPGIIPRRPHPPEPEDGDGSSVCSDWAGSQGAPTIPPTKDVVVNGIVVKVKYCQTCMLYRPPRCSHCSICNNCVERFDHHCPWVGQCIGKRNYRFFFMFVSSTTLLCLYVHAFCWVNIKNIMDADNCSLWRAISKSPASGTLIIYTFIASWFVGGLTVFHVYLIVTNQTTYENFRYRYDMKMNPYNLGCGRNIVETLFSKIPKSKNDFRAKVKGDPPSLFHNSVSLGHSTSPEVPKRSFDMEMGKRRAVVAEEFEAIHSSVGGLERCGTQPRRASWNQKSNWEITPDIHMMNAEFGMEDGFTNREKISGGL